MNETEEEEEVEDEEVRVTFKKYIKEYGDKYYLKTTDYFFAKKYKNEIHTKIHKMNSHEFRSLARRGGIKRIKGLNYDDNVNVNEIERILDEFLKTIIHETVTNMVNAKRKTVIASDVINALKSQFTHLFGSNDPKKE